MWDSRKEKRGLLDWRRRHIPSINPWKWSIELLSYITLAHRIVRWPIGRIGFACF